MGNIIFGVIATITFIILVFLKYRDMKADAKKIGYIMQELNDIKQIIKERKGIEPKKQ